MGDIRIFIIDDSSVVRRLLTRVIEEEPGLAVAGQAANGRLALEKLDALAPDLVTLDVEMPEMDGLATLVEIRRRRPRLPVIMFSTLTSRGAATTIEALSLGASDYLTKPAGATSLMESMERLRQDLVPKVRALVRVREERGQDQPARGDLRSNMTAPSTSGPAQVGPPPLQRAGTSAQLMQHRERYPERRPFQPSGRHLMRPAELVVVGVSTGGPNALARFIPALPGNLPVPVLIVQHMPPLFTRMLADRLDQNSQLKVREAEAGAVLRPGEAWVAKGDWHMEVARESGQLLLKEHQGPQVNSCRPAVDTLFQSAAQACPATAVAVVLTGMGRDGLRGARAIREGGGLVLAQDEESSVVWGMPGAVSNAGVADQVLPLDQLAPHLLQSLRRDRSTTTGAGPWR